MIDPGKAIISLMVVVIAALLLSLFAVFDFRGGKCTFITYPAPVATPDLAPKGRPFTTAFSPVPWPMILACVEEYKILDDGCDPRYQDCKQVFYMQDRSNKGRFLRVYHQFAPWFGRHEPKQFGERSWTLQPLWNFLKR